MNKNEALKNEKTDIIADTICKFADSDHTWRYANILILNRKCPAHDQGRERQIATRKDSGGIIVPSLIVKLMSLHIIVDIVGRHLTPINRQETGMKKNVVE